MKTCNYCNMQFNDEDVSKDRPGFKCVHCEPMVKKMNSDAKRSLWYAEQGINQEQLRRDKAFEMRFDDSYVSAYKGAESTHLSAPPRWINDQG